MGYLTTHVMNIVDGIPASGMKIDLYRVSDQLDGKRTYIKSAVTNQDGRCDEPLLQEAAFQTCIYELIFAAGAYFIGRGLKLEQPCFVDEVVLRFGIADTSLHYHVPLLVSPWSYSTYRGS